MLKTGDENSTVPGTADHTEVRVQGAGDSTQVHAHQPKCLSPSGG